jgi:hypothetical protein
MMDEVMTMKRLLLPIAALALISAAPVQQPPAPAQPAPAPAAAPAPVPDEPEGKKGTYIGVASCANGGCHGSTQPLNVTRILQNEYFTWLNNDRHARAYNVLFNDRSARVAKNMHLKKKAYEEAVCLDCHSTHVPPSVIAGKIDLEDGVQCEACHGAAGGWRAQHSEANWTHEKSVELGMVDLRNVSTRANSCLACHLGDSKREVDHELIASGHPLLAFELDNYTETMPPHWNRHPDSHGVRAWATGQVIAFRDSMANLARHARGEKWPEFSDMSCFNCHHALKNSQWRQERGWESRAGLPAWSPQHWGVLRLIIDRSSPSVRSDLDSAVQEVSYSVSHMNDTARVANAADRARQLADKIISKIDSDKWSDKDVRALMIAIIDDRDFINRADVQSAEQAALALQSLSSDLTRRNPKLLKSPMTKSIDDLFREIQSRDDYEPSRFLEKLAAVKGTL